MNRCRISLPIFLLFLAACAIVRTARAEPFVEADAAAVASVAEKYNKQSTAILHLDLAKTFGIKLHWIFVAAQEPRTKPENEYDDDELGKIHLCLVRDLKADCSAASFFRPGDNPDSHLDSFRTLLRADIVYSQPNHSHPLLLLVLGATPSGDGDILRTTIVVDFDRKTENFYNVFTGGVGSNNNQDIRFIEDGPLTGVIVMNEPTQNAPFAYYLDLFKLRGGRYDKVLEYRTKTLYGDGNRLSVIDAEMVEIERRLHIWKSGDPLPVPDPLPDGCRSVVLLHGVVWCIGLGH